MQPINFSNGPAWNTFDHKLFLDKFKFLTINFNVIFIKKNYEISCQKFQSIVVGVFYRTLGN